jgi:hypothetical protein
MPNYSLSNLSATAAKVPYLGYFFQPSPSNETPKSAVSENQNPHKRVEGERMVEPVSLSELHEKLKEHKGNSGAWKSYVSEQGALKLPHDRLLELLDSRFEAQKELFKERKELYQDQKNDTMIKASGMTAAVSGSYSFLDTCWQLLQSATSSNDESLGHSRLAIFGVFAVTAVACLARVYNYNQRATTLTEQINEINAEVHSLLAGIEETHKEIYQEYAVKFGLKRVEEDESIELSADSTDKSQEPETPKLKMA